MRPKLIIIAISFVAIAMSESVLGLFDISITGLRHVLLLLCVFSLISHSCKKSTLPKFYYIFIFLIFYIGIIGSYGRDTPFFNVLIGSIFTLFPFILYETSQRVQISKFELIEFFKFFVLFCLIFGLYPVLKHVPKIPEAMRWEFGVFRELGAYATVMNIGVAASLILSVVLKEKKYFYYALFLSSFIFITILKKNIISNLLIWYIFFHYNKSSKIKYQKYLLIILSLLFVFAMSDAIFMNISENSDYLAESGINNHVRIGMYIISFDIAYKSIPFGSGFGSFGSLASIFNFYSPIYYEYSVDKIGSNSEEHVMLGEHTLLDTFWPHILAELGFLGSLFYIILTFYPIYYSFVYLNNKSLSIFKKQLAIFVMTLHLMIAWEGLTLYHPETPVFMFFTGVLSGIILRFLKKYNDRYTSLG